MQGRGQLHDLTILLPEIEACGKHLW